MAKKRTARKPAILQQSDALPGEESVPDHWEAESLADPEPAPEPSVRVSSRSVKVPAVKDFPGYAARRVDVHLDSVQSENLRDITEGLKASRAKLANGREVQRPGDVVRWLLEQAG